MGPFCVTQSNLTRQLTDPTRPNVIQLTKSLQFSSDVFLYTELIGSGTGQIGRKIKFNAW